MGHEWVEGWGISALQTVRDGETVNVYGAGHRQEAVGCEHGGWFRLRGTRQSSGTCGVSAVVAGTMARMLLMYARLGMAARRLPTHQLAYFWSVAGYRPLPSLRI